MKELNCRPATVGKTPEMNAISQYPALDYSKGEVFRYRKLEWKFDFEFTKKTGRRTSGVFFENSKQHKIFTQKESEVRPREQQNLHIRSEKEQLYICIINSGSVGFK